MVKRWKVRGKQAGTRFACAARETSRAGTFSRAGPINSRNSAQLCSWSDAFAFSKGHFRRFVTQSKRHATLRSNQYCREGQGAIDQRVQWHAVAFFYSESQFCLFTPPRMPKRSPPLPYPGRTPTLQRLHRRPIRNRNMNCSFWCLMASVA